ncbi:Uncharacterised protein [Mycobacteroides abscessus subsp. bolletii]|nr:Uncharacterised protein [Mycobacteroides abscessus]SKF61040.1 Uncharacterised protein [Mycobacteroides abscessus subsp. bolletii]SKH65304.1 Uncharacterised protein [Mycobacteroides abscessus subsp. bolletii]
MRHNEYVEELAAEVTSGSLSMDDAADQSRQSIAVDSALDTHSMTHPESRKRWRSVPLPASKLTRPRTVRINYQNSKRQVARSKVEG